MKEFLEFSTVSLEWLVVLSLGTGIGVAVWLMWLLARVGATYPMVGGKPPPTDEQRSEATPQAGAGGAWGFAVCAFMVGGLFTVQIDHYNRLSFDLLTLGVCVIGAGMLAYGLHRSFLRQLRPFDYSMLGITPIKEAVVITGTIFALFAGKIAVFSLSKSSNSNMAAVYGQIYENDSRTTAQELQNPELQRLYLQVDFVSDSGGQLRTLKPEDFADPETVAKRYWDVRLAHYLEYDVLSADAELGRREVEAVAALGLIDVAAVLEFVEGKSARKDRALSRTLAQGNSHVTSIVSSLHQVHDYTARDVIPPGDTDTWFGYFEDIGPHPIALAVLWNWLDRSYMTYEFFAIAEERISGKRKLIEFLNAYPDDEHASELRAQMERNAPAVTPKSSLMPRIVRLPDNFYGEMARFIDAQEKSRRHRGERSRELYRSLAELAVYNRFVVMRPEYNRLVHKLVSDVNDTIEE